MTESKELVVFSDKFEAVTDADEEIFILYSEKQLLKPAESDFRGLGYLDSHTDVIEIKFEVKGTSEVKPRPKGRTRIAKEKPTSKTIEFELHQDKTSLRSRKGDTGSVLWRASIDFAQMILQQSYAKPPVCLFDYDILRQSHVLELGAGTGFLSIALSSLVDHYTVTDSEALLPLIRKNVNQNGAPSNVSIEELDWIILQSASASIRSKIYDPQHRPIDLLLAVDCLYHPSLIPPFLETLDYLCIEGRTTAMIISELRQEDVMREFLEAWLSRSGWKIWRVPNDDLGKHYVIWLGTKGKPLDG